MVKDRTLEKLREESEYIHSFIRFFLFIYGFYILITTFFLLGCLVLADGIAAALSNPGSGGAAAHAFAMLLSSFVGENLVNSAGKLHLMGIAAEILPRIISYTVMFYIFSCLIKIFESIKKEETPFTLENASRWKKCSRIFAALAVIQFLTAFVIPGLIFFILFPLMASCFFQALGLLFEYGSRLQQESDETL